MEAQLAAYSTREEILQRNAAGRESGWSRCARMAMRGGQRFDRRQGQAIDFEHPHLPFMDQRTYGVFFQENPLFFQKTRNRMISYWDCDYRCLYKREADYVGFRLFDRFREWCAAA
ncbi:hypothetical protein M0D69_34935 [Caballeronia sp. SEWSISQ10-4 2]|uniref:hypothetical protein n=1 Tax=Caballeronia sp. SEWSISQ10-4 2 TaxID=2937438 RepID=UPI002654EBB7|nr:hypothetical protein [Caballeronia sp. SEWSISQ10-4 2]MDN7183119.1 hypothetical protein [Caballeronia sp. SEWSISQ10-4 2]